MLVKRKQKQGWEEKGWGGGGGGNSVPGVPVWLVRQGHQ